MSRPHLRLRGLLWRCTGGAVVGWGTTPLFAYNDWALGRRRWEALERMMPPPAPAPRRLSRRMAWLFNTLPGAFLVGATLGLLYYLCHG